MEELKTTEYNRFKGGIRSQYKNLLVEKEMQLKNIEEHNQKLHDKICRKCAEYDMFCDLYGAVSQKADDVSVEIKIEELKKEIEWLKSNIEE